MGWWQTQQGIIGDAPADVLEKALQDIAQLYQQDMKRPPTQGEIADLFQFCTSNEVICMCRKPTQPYSS